ncbi:tetratricopeptide repeat protein 23 isoform X2 [Pristis pectinata]|uniref:tetratricopeptide repeat protein 23 isoform X2 n=1 Tax=Pristis pectinata TaxID=685728 RepID=UPI00223D016D|nr:tetratricopeptide repeat protein 23 isoform X2 [Pristis pectinata]
MSSAEEDLASEVSSRINSPGAETQYCDTRTSSGSSETPSTLNGSARVRRKQRNALKEVAIMILPEEKLAQAEQRARMHSANGEEVPAVQELMRCLALARISFGDFHWRMAHAHINLAKGYLDLKGQALQAKQHCEKAKDIMYANTQLPAFEEERREILRCLITMFLTLGKALLELENLKEAEQSLLKSEKVADELRRAEEVMQEEMRQVDTKINLALGRLHMKESRWNKAVASYQKALGLVQLDKGEKSMECVSIYQDLAAAELAGGGHDMRVQYLLQAHSIVLTNAPSGEEEGKITLALAEAYTSTGRAEDHDIAEQYYQQSLQCYQAAMGPEHPSSLSVLDSYSRFLILTKNYLGASKLLQESLPAKLSTFGDFSAEVEETYRLFGGIELAQGHQKAAFKKFKRMLPDLTGVSAICYF